MVAIPLAILALAAGVYLLTYVKQFSLGALYKYLSWLVILLSLAFILGGIARGVMHYRHMRSCQASGHCEMGQGGACPYMKSGNCSMMGSNCNMSGHSEGSMKDCCMEKKDCCKEGGMKECCKDMKKGMGSCSDMKEGNEKPACCAKGAGMDSMAKK